MPKKLMAKYECDRCARVWYEDHVEGVELPEPPSLDIAYRRGEVLMINFSTLCESCTSAVEGYLKSIGKELKHKSPERGAKKKDDGPSS